MSNLEMGKSLSLTLLFGADMGSEKPKNGRARLMKPFLYSSSFLWPWISWR